MLSLFYSFLLALSSSVILFFSRFSVSPALQFTFSCFRSPAFLLCASFWFFSFFFSNSFLSHLLLHCFVSSFIISFLSSFPFSSLFCLLNLSSFSVCFFSCNPSRVLFSSLFFFNVFFTFCLPTCFSGCPQPTRSETRKHRFRTPILQKHAQVSQWIWCSGDFGLGRSNCSLLLSISLLLSFLHPLVQSFLSFLLPLSSFLVFRSFASFHILVFSFSPFLAFVHPFILGYFRFYITFPSNSFLSHLLLHCFVSSFIISFLSSLPFSSLFFSQIPPLFFLFVFSLVILLAFSSLLYSSLMFFKILPSNVFCRVSSTDPVWNPKASFQDTHIAKTCAGFSMNLMYWGRSNCSLLLSISLLCYTLLFNHSFLFFFHCPLFSFFAPSLHFTFLCSLSLPFLPLCILLFSVIFVSTLHFLPIPSFPIYFFTASFLSLSHFFLLPFSSLFCLLNLSSFVLFVFFSCNPSCVLFSSLFFFNVFLRFCLPTCFSGCPRPTRFETRKHRFRTPILQKHAQVSQWIWCSGDFGLGRSNCSLLLSISLPLSFLHPLVQSFLSFLLPLSSFLVFRSFASFHILVFSFSPFLAFVHPFILGYFRFYITFPSNSFLSHLLLHCFVSFIISFLSSLPFSSLFLSLKSLLFLFVFFSCNPFRVLFSCLFFFNVFLDFAFQRVFQGVVSWNDAFGFQTG